MIKAPYSLRAMEAAKQSCRWDKRLRKQWNRVCKSFKYAYEKCGDEVLEYMFYTLFWTFVFGAFLYYGR